MRIFLQTILCTTLLLSACTSSQKLMESGNYDEAIDRTLDAVLSSKKAEKRDEQLKVLEKAYTAAMNKDKLQVEQLKALQHMEYWPRIANIYDRMQHRQDKLANCLPLMYSNGQAADIALWNIDAVRQEAKENAAQYYYDLAAPLVSSTRKSDIRNGFHYLQEAAEYVYNYKDVRQLLQETAVKGTNYIYMYAEVGNTFPFMYPSGLVDRFFSKEITPDSEWLQYDRQQAGNRNYDYTVRVVLSDMERSPESVRERVRDESRDIDDGWQYVYDSNGNVKKDSLGNDIKVPKTLRVTAQVLETVQSKACRINAVTEIIHLPSGRVVDATPVYGEALFSNVAYNYRGDKRALSQETIQKLGNIPIPFPTDDEMIFLAVEKLQESVYRLINDREKLLLQ